MNATNLPVDSSLFFKLVRVVNLTARPFIETVGRAHDLSINEWRAMVVLASHPGVAATDVAESTGLDKMSVSRAITSLERKGHVERVPHPDDLRKIRVRLTTAGRRVFRQIGRQAKQREAALFGAISPAELAAVEATLDKLIDTLRQAG